MKVGVKKKEKKVLSRYLANYYV